MKKILLTCMLACSSLAYAQAAQGEKEYRSGMEFINKYYKDENNTNAKAAIPLLKKAANLGNSQAMYELSTLYARGIGVIESKEQADQWLQRAANNDNADAIYNLAFDAQQQNDEKRYHELLEKAAQLGSADAAEDIANKLFDNDKAHESLHWYTLAAQRGSSRSMVILGKMYFYGYGTTQSYANAKKWFAQAYQNKHSDGAVGLAKINLQEHTDEHSEQKAQHFYEEALTLNKTNTEALYYFAVKTAETKNKKLIEENITALKKIFDEISIQELSIGGGQVNLFLGDQFSKGTYVLQSFPTAIYHYSMSRYVYPESVYPHIAELYAHEHISLSDGVSITDLLCTSDWLAKQPSRDKDDLREKFEKRLSQEIDHSEIISAKKEISLKSCSSTNTVAMDISNTAAE